MKWTTILQGTLLLTVIIFYSCEKTPEEQLENQEYFIFGHFYGECMGEGCVEIYKIENETLLEDINDIYPGLSASEENYPGDFQLLDQAIYESVAGIETQLPTELFDETEKVIGQPDAGDWGGIYIEVFDGTETNFWLIDTMHDNLPAYLPAFVDAVQEAITTINN